MDTEKATELIVAAILGFAVHATLKFIKPKSRLSSGRRTISCFRTSSGTSISIRRPITIQNLGSDNAEFIEIVHRRKPDFFKLQPSLNYTEITAPSGNHVIAIESLSPKEFLSLEMLSYRTLPEFLYVRCKDGYAKPIVFSLQRALPRWAKHMVKSIFGIGLLTIGYGTYCLMSLLFAAFLNQ